MFVSVLNSWELKAFILKYIHLQLNPAVIEAKNMYYHLVIMLYSWLHAFMPKHIIICVFLCNRIRRRGLKLCNSENDLLLSCPLLHSTAWPPSCTPRTKAKRTCAGCCCSTAPTSTATSTSTATRRWCSPACQVGSRAEITPRLRFDPQRLTWAAALRPQGRPTSPGWCWTPARKRTWPTPWGARRRRWQLLSVRWDVFWPFRKISSRKPKQILSLSRRSCDGWAELSHLQSTELHLRLSFLLLDLVFYFEKPPASLICCAN